MNRLAAVQRYHHRSTANLSGTLRIFSLSPCSIQAAYEDEVCTECLGIARYAAAKLIFCIKWEQDQQGQLGLYPRSLLGALAITCLTTYGTFIGMALAPGTCLCLRRKEHHAKSSPMWIEWPGSLLPSSAHSGTVAANPSTKADWVHLTTILRLK